MSFLAELKRRNVIRVAVAYLVFGWVVMQVLDVIGPVMLLPAGSARVVLVLLALGFVAALIVSWVYELTPEGLRRESQVDRAESIAHVTARKLDIAVIVLLVVAMGMFAYDRFLPRKMAETTEVAASRADASPAAPAPSDNAQPDTKSIAVLPFVNMSSDPEQVYFSDGISEELLNALVKLPGLKVAGRTSSFAFRDKQDDLREIGKALNVGHILEGSVRKQGMRIRITAQLVKADDGFHLWSETYDRDAGDIFALQDEITAAIIDALKVQLGTQAPTAPVTDFGAYNLYLQARQKYALRGVENLAEARSLLQRAIAIDPTYAPAHASLARTVTLLHYYGIDRGKDQPITREQAAAESKAAAEAALALDPDNAVAWSVIGFVGLLLEPDIAAADKAIAHSVELAPNDAEILNFAGDFYYWTLDPRTEATERRAAALDPLGGYNHNDVAQILVRLGRYEAALESAAVAESLGFYEAAPTNYIVTSFPALIALKRFDEALALVDRIESGVGVNAAFALSLRAWIARARGDTSAADAMLDELLRRASAGELLASTMAWHLLQAGRNDAAVTWLERAFAAGDLGITEPQLYPLPERLPDHPGVRATYQRPELQELFERRRLNLARAAEASP